MPAGMSFVQLEGNYVISFRDMSEALPAFTAVKLDRRRGSWHGGSEAVGSTTSLSAAGAGPRRGSVSVVGAGNSLASLGMSASGSLAGSRGTLGDDLTASEAAAGRRRSSLAATPFKLVLTGVPRAVPEDKIRAHLESVITGIERVYRGPARDLTHPPVFVETRSALAQDAFMLRAEWVPVVQRLIKEANVPAASKDEGLGSSFTISMRADSREDANEDADDETRRRESLADTLVTCPHGRYHGLATCPVCRVGARRSTMVADDFLGHNVADVVMRPQAVLAERPAKAPPTAAAAAKPKSSCTSCMACLRRLVPGKRRTRAQDVDDDEFAPQIELKGSTTLPAADDAVLDPGLLFAIKSKRRMSAYDDVPSIKVDSVK